MKTLRRSGMDPDILNIIEMETIKFPIWSTGMKIWSHILYVKLNVFTREIQNKIEKKNKLKKIIFPELYTFFKKVL